MKTLEQTINRVLTRLEDTDNVIWSRSEITTYLKNGYDNMVRATQCLWDMTFAAENVTYCANHTSIWEELYMDNVSNFLILNRFTFTGGTGTSNPQLWEQQYADNGVGPCNHTNLWEDSYTFNDFFLATAQLPASTIAVDRVTFDNYRIEPYFSKDLASKYSYYEYVQGAAYAYALDKDGSFTLRKVPVPSLAGTSYTHTGNRGLLRSQTANEFETNPTIIGNGRGLLRSVPKHFPIGTVGVARRLTSDVKNVRVEYFRRGNDLSDSPFELPDRYVKYVELYAMSLARERDGDGQNKQIAAHYRQRYQMGVDRITNRLRMLVRDRVNRMGGGNAGSSWPSLPKLPAFYPQLPR